MDPRHLQRIKIVQNLFAYSHTRYKTLPGYNKLLNNLPYPKDSKTKKIITKLTAIDQYIKTYAARYPLENLSLIHI